MSLAPKDPWEHLAALTPARVALGRAGSGLPTAELLRFELAHARARDAVGETLDVTSLHAELAAAGLPVLHVTSRAADRRTYLQRPDLGRRLDEASARQLAAAGGTRSRRPRRGDRRRPVRARRAAPRGADRRRPAAAVSTGSGSRRSSSPRKAAWPWPTKWEPCSARGWR